MAFKNLVTRMLEGKEKSEEYARSTLPTNRFQLFWDIFKGNFGKIVKINILVLIFFIPVFFVLIVNRMLTLSNASLLPYGSNLGVGYPGFPVMAGVYEGSVLQTGFVTCIGIIVSAFIAAIGLSGGMYVMRNMVWTEGIFVANDFWRGVKLNYKNALQTALFYSFVLLVGISAINMADLYLASFEVTKFYRAMLYISKGISYAIIVISTFMAFWQIALGVNYTMKYRTLFKNSFLLTVGMLPQTVFFVFIALIPFLLYLFGVGLLTTIAVIITILFAFSFALLVWLDFAQWTFDKFINPKISGAKVGRGIYNKDGTSQMQNGESAAEKEYTRLIVSAGKSDLIAKPIKPIDDSLQVYELPTSFSREDLKRLRESKDNIMQDTEAYAEEHKNDLKYVEYNKQFEARERALSEEEIKNHKKKSKK